MHRSAGILCPIFSLPSKQGIGTLGRSAYEFVDFLANAKQHYWQILPIGCTGFNDSPYQSFSAFAGNPYFIDYESLKDQGYLKETEYATLDYGKDAGRVDYEKIYHNNHKVLAYACKRLIEEDPKSFQDFCKEESDWLDDYALFMALKQRFDQHSLLEWPLAFRLKEKEAIDFVKKELHDEIQYFKAQQYFFFDQYMKLKEYANEKGVYIIGDIPIYVALDSVDVWCDPKQFQLNEMLEPVNVAGCPPDGFSADGQLWGNPLFDWDAMAHDGYSWWIKRIKHQLKFVDVLRIDHFRGFESYYSIPYGHTNAREGKWNKGPGLALFDRIKEVLGDIDIIAEDLGFLTQEVIDMVRDSGFPGMKILQFAFDSRDTGSGYLPHTYPRNCIVYTGTHDNDTVLGWAKGSNPDDFAYAKEYLWLNEEEGYAWGMIRGAMASVADLSIIMLQDYLELDSSARINVPSVAGGNWSWRFDPESLTPALAKKIARMTMIYGRVCNEG